MSNVYENAARSIRSDIIGMVFGEEDLIDAEQEAKMALFTNAKMRRDLPDSRIVWKKGVARYPEINHFTGQVALYNNLNVLKLAGNKKIAEILSSFYKVPVDTLGMLQGPPALIVKPMGAGASHPFVHSFGALDDDRQRYTAMLCVSSNAENAQSGGVELLENFDVYYDLLSKYYDFGAHCKTGDILHLETKWFSIEDANRVIEDYTVLYNYYERNISCTLERAVTFEVSEVYADFKFPVPEVFRPLRWTPMQSRQGSLHVFSSKQAVRTSSNRFEKTRIYMQIPMEPKPEGWEGSEAQRGLKESYDTGKFGDWSKPGVRRYLRENSTEYNYRLGKVAENDLREAFVERHRSLFGL